MCVRNYIVLKMNIFWWKYCAYFRKKCARCTHAHTQSGSVYVSIRFMHEYIVSSFRSTAKTKKKMNCDLIISQICVPTSIVLPKFFCSIFVLQQHSIEAVARKEMKYLCSSECKCLRAMKHQCQWFSLFIQWFVIRDISVMTPFKLHEPFDFPLQ